MEIPLMKMFRNLISVSGFSGDDVTLDEFKKLPQAESPMGKLFLSLLEVDWDDSMEIDGSFPTDRNHCIRIYSDDLFRVSYKGPRMLRFDGKESAPSIDKVMKKIYESIRGRTSSIEESIATLQEDHEKILERGRQMQVKIARKFFETYDPPIKIETEKFYEYYLFFLEAGERGRVFRLWLSGHFLPAIYILDRDTYLQHMVTRPFPDKNMLLNEGQKFS